MLTKNGWRISAIVAGAILLQACGGSESNIAAPAPQATDYSEKACPLNDYQVLTFTPVDVDAIRVIMPLGEMGVPHTLPLHHTYWNLTSIDNNDIFAGSLQANLYAPADAEIVAVTYNTVKNDWDLHIRPCKDMKVYYSHIQSLTSDPDEFGPNGLLGAIGSMAPEDVAVFGDDLNKAVSIKVKGGQKLGIVGGPGILSFDMGFIDRTKTANAFVRPERYDPTAAINSMNPLPPNFTVDLAWDLVPQRLYQFCPLNYFPVALGLELEAKLGGAFGEPALGDPTCGSTMRDVPGTMAGSWFVSPDVAPLTLDENDTLAAAVHYVDATKRELSLPNKHVETPWDGNFIFTGTDAGNTNRKFETVNDSGVYCYDGLVTKMGASLTGRILMQLGGQDNSELTVQYDDGKTCVDTLAFNVDTQHVNYHPIVTFYR